MFIKTGRLALFAILLSGCSSTMQNSHEVSAQPLANKDCIQSIIEKNEVENNIPKGILTSIAKVESKCKPYAVNTRKKSYTFDNKEQAVNFVNAAVKKGDTNISIGCFQLHYKSHRSKFASIASMLTPEENIAYGARLLKELYNRHGSWEKAIKFYHAKSSKYNQPYYRKVMNHLKLINHSK